MKPSRILCTILFLAGMSMANVSYAQHHRGSGPVSPMEVGSTTFSAGIGAGSYYSGDYYTTPFGIKAVVEHGMWQAGPGAVTLGGEFGGSFSTGGYYDNYHSSTIVFAVRAAWHCGWDVPGLDTYGGVSAGLGFHHYSYQNVSDYSHTSVIPVPGVYVGASYFVTSSFGFNAEAGDDITNIQIGVVLKLN